jgi:tetratricopeptide (TPR) repeat protein
MCRVFISEEMMLNLAAKLKGNHMKSPKQSPSAIFGEIAKSPLLAESGRSKLRIGFWPIRSETEPAVAMGLVTLLASILEQWPNVQVYRLLAQVEDETQGYQWTIDKSQFGVDDWELDGLDENAATWGTLTQSESGYELALEIENDLANDEGKSETWMAGNLNQLVDLLPQIAETIAIYLGAGDIDPTNQVYESKQYSDDILKQILEANFEWELALFLNLWGMPWTDDQIIAAYEKLSSFSKQLNGDLGEWITSNAAARVLSPLHPYLDANTKLLEYVEKASLESASSLIYRHGIAVALYRAGYTVSAFDLLELNVEQYPDNPISWSTLIEFYWQSSEIGTALNTIQRAIQTDSAPASIYVRYAEILLAFDASNLVINVGAKRTTSTGRTFTEDYIFIDPDSIRVNRLIHEAVKSYQSALLLDPNNADVLSSLLIHLIDLQESSLWTQFRRLVDLDQEGTHIRNSIEAMSSLEDIQPAIDILFSFLEMHPDHLQMHLNLASAYVLADQTDKAQYELEIARKLSQSKQTDSEIERLSLSAADPDFDARLGEIAELLDAGSEISSEDVEFLELALGNAPSFAAGYILLANAYINWGEASDALDTLLDGQREIPDEPDISALLGRVLWEAGEEQLAFDALNTALTKNPNHVPTLATMGRFMFEDGQEDEAKIFLARAEAIDPRNATLNDARIHIANMLAGLDTD